LFSLKIFRLFLLPKEKKFVTKIGGSLKSLNKKWRKNIMENVVKSTAVKRKQNVRKLTALGMLGAISLILVATVHFPIIPAAPFLEYDPADVPILIGTFAFGPVAGFLLTVVVSIIQGMTVSAASGGPIGIIMHIFATGSCVLIAGNIYRRNKTRKTAAIALIVGALIMTGAMVLMNLVLTPIFLGTSMEEVIPMLLPAIIPFNLIKAGLNCAITFVLYKSISHLLKGE
jgi:hypothetical protein ELI_0978